LTERVRAKASVPEPALVPGLESVLVRALERRQSVQSE
jgi:hypothetical protein